MRCEYCGNSSGKTDGRGNCISCGAELLYSAYKKHMDIHYAPDPFDIARRARELAGKVDECASFQIQLMKMQTQQMLEMLDQN